MNKRYYACTVAAIAVIAAAVTGCGGGGGSSSGGPAINSITISGLSQVAGPEDGQTLVTITGTGFSKSPVTVFFGSVPSSTSITTSDTSINTVSPKGTGMVDVRLVNADGTSAIVPADQFTYVPSPPLPPPG